MRPLFATALVTAVILRAAPANALVYLVTSDKSRPCATRDDFKTVFDALGSLYVNFGPRLHVTSEPRQSKDGLFFKAEVKNPDGSVEPFAITETLVACRHLSYVMFGESKPDQSAREVLEIDPKVLPRSYQSYDGKMVSFLVDGYIRLGRHPKAPGCLYAAQYPNIDLLMTRKLARKWLKLGRNEMSAGPVRITGTVEHAKQGNDLLVDVKDVELVN